VSRRIALLVSDPRISLEFIAEQGSRLLDEVRLVREEQREQRLRLGAVERNLAQLTSQVVSELAQVNLRLDRMHDRLDRIERRLDLVEDPSPA
jgi:division protein CdvB (Snf7/Vps24/ESCRT-III family)